MVTRQEALLACLVAVTLAACSTAKGGWNSLRSLRARQAVEQHSAELSRFLGNIQRIELEIAEAMVHSRELEAELANQAEIVRSKSLLLGEKLSVLRALEEDLTVASKREQAIEVALTELLAMELRYGQREQLSKDLDAKLISLEQSLGPLQAAVASKQAETTSKAAELRAILVTLDQITSQLQAALAAVQAGPTGSVRVPPKQAGKQDSKSR